MKSFDDVEPFPLPSVAPYAGAWIEMGIRLSFLTRRGVAPYAGAWIEIIMLVIDDVPRLGRSLRGSVD